MTLPPSILEKPELDSSFTSTGLKLFHHQEAMQALRDGRGMPISCWIAPTDVCNAKCSFCSVGERAGDSLRFSQITEFLSQLIERGLKSVTFSGGGNPLLYKCKETGKTLEDCIRYAHGAGLEVALITNGMPMVNYHWEVKSPCVTEGGEVSALRFIQQDHGKPFPRFMGGTRKSWKTLSPEALDMLTWCRISMAGLDHNHKEQCVYVPDFDPTKTALGFSWIMSDSYEEPTHKHGWVSTPEDVKGDPAERDSVHAEERLPWIEQEIRKYVEQHKPRYVRLLANCLQPALIPHRHKILQDMAIRINPDVVFSQNKPPRQPKTCYKVLTRPCLNADGWVYPCDSVVLNKTANHKFGSIWRVCLAEQVGQMLDSPSSYSMPDGVCPGCVFADQVDVINDVVHGAPTPMSDKETEHVNFV